MEEPARADMLCLGAPATSGTSARTQHERAVVALAKYLCAQPAGGGDAGAARLALPAPVQEATAHQAKGTSHERATAHPPSLRKAGRPTFRS